jgi:hypothetical protein
MVNSHYSPARISYRQDVSHCRESTDLLQHLARRIAKAHSVDEDEIRPTAAGDSRSMRTAACDSRNRHKFLPVSIRLAHATACSVDSLGPRHRADISWVAGMEQRAATGHLDYNFPREP